MRRVLAPAEFSDLAHGFSAWDSARPLTSRWLPIGVVTDKTDGKLAHLDGLNLSRAWMLEGIASGSRPPIRAGARCWRRRRRTPRADWRR